MIVLGLCHHFELLAVLKGDAKQLCGGPRCLGDVG